MDSASETKSSTSCTATTSRKSRYSIPYMCPLNNLRLSQGIWLEAWHQKLHNNTTPDDVPICEAYIKFMESGGNADVYWRHLSDNGAT